MTKKLASTTSNGSAAIAALLALFALIAMAALILPACATQAHALQAGLTTAPSHELGAQRIEVSDTTEYVYNEKQAFAQGTNTVQVYDIGDLRSNPYSDNSRIVITKVAGNGTVAYKAEKSRDNCFRMAATQPGKVTVTCKETWTETEGHYSSKTYEWVEKTKKKSKTHRFVVYFVSLDNLTGPVAKCTTSTYNRSATFVFNISGLAADANVEFVSDSNKLGSASVSAVAKGKVGLYVYGIGTHVIRLKAYHKTFTCVAVLRSLSMDMSGDLKNTGSLVTYPGKKSQLAVKLSGVKNPAVTWKTSNSKIAYVNRYGTVLARGKGCCYIYAIVDGGYIKTLVEVTSHDAYQAVCNAFTDLHAGISYSQAERMSYNKRDCSSFVSRCYWDDSLDRHIFVIGDDWARNWAYTAAGQAQWLNDHGKRVSWGACALKWLRPGDTVYFETDYAGKDSSQWRYIDHAGMYVGNGLILNTHGSGGNGDVGFRSYWPKDSSVKFIGRPCP